MHENFRRSINDESVDEVRVDGMSMIDVVKFIREQLLWICGVALLGALIGIGMAAVAPKQWQASVTLQVGQIGHEDRSGWDLIEPVASVVEQIHLGWFQDKVIGAMKSQPPSSRDEALIRGTLGGQAIINTNLIRLSVRGYSPAWAKATLQSAQDQIIAIHAKLAQPAIASIQAALHQIDTGSADVEKRRSQLESFMSANVGKISAGASSDRLMYDMLLDRLNTQQRDFAERKLELLERASPERTFLTRPIDNIQVSTQPVFPSYKRFIAMGILGGLVFGILIGWYRHAAVRRRRL